MTTGGFLRKPVDQATRKGIVKAQALQIAQPPLQSKEEIPLIQSKYEPTNVTLKKIHGSTKFVPVVVFIPAPIEGDQVHLHWILGEDSLAQIEGGRLTKVLEGREGTSEKLKEKATVAFGDVAVDFVRMEVFLKKERVALTTLQFKTLRYLTRHARRVISRDELLNEVWGYEHYPTTRTVDNIILKLRQKLERNPSRPVHFRTIRGIGYKFSP